MKNILVTNTSLSNKTAHLKVAFQLAEKFDANVNCLYVERSLHDSRYGGGVSIYLENALQEQLDRELKLAREEFEHTFSSRSSQSLFLHERSHSPESIRRNMYISDLIVTEQQMPDKGAFDYWNRPQDIIMQSGRPVMMIPYVGVSQPVGEHMMIAWDHGKEVSRAVHDALPLLKAAKSVNILTVEEKKDHPLASANLAKFLSSHGVNVQAHEDIKTKVPIAETVLSRIADTGSDSLVMGAYGHSRFREYAFGGVTKTLLGSATVPVIMSH